jgi:MATE family multidrug resistance protein
MSLIKYKQIHRLAIPALISGIAEPILSITDTAIVGNIEYNSTEALGAVGIVGAFLSMLVWVFGQKRSVIASIVSQAIGAKNIDEIKSLPSQAIFIILLFSLLIIGITYPFAENLFGLYNASDLVLEYSVDYYKIRVIGIPFTLITIGIFGIFRGLQNTVIPMRIAVVGTLLNVFLDVIFVYGVDGWINPMHINGAAYASVIAQLVMTCLAVYLLYNKTQITLKFSLPFNKKIKGFLLMFSNLIIRTIALNIALYFGSSFAAKYGNEFIAAYTIAINLWFLGAFVIDGYSSAGTILSGKLFGEKSYKLLVDLAVKLTIIGFILGLVMLIIGWIFYDYLGLIFTQEKMVLLEFSNVLWMVLIMQPLCAIAFIYDGIFKGLGWMKELRNVLLFSTFMVFLPTLLLADSYGYELEGIFFAFTLWIIARGVPLIIKFYKTCVPLAQKM